jgi:hypothetical protein
MRKKSGTFRKLLSYWDVRGECDGLESTGFLGTREGVMD